jgi:hypothetical protein
MIRTREEVAKILEDFVSCRGHAWDWDDFLSFQMEDEELESIRARCNGLDAEFPATEKGHFCGPDGFEIFRGYMRDSFECGDPSVGGDGKAPANRRTPRGEHKAKNNVCFLFAMMVVWASSFSTGARCGVFRTVF